MLVVVCLLDVLVDYVGSLLCGRYCAVVHASSVLHALPAALFLSSSLCPVVQARTNHTRMHIVMRGGAGTYKSPLGSVELPPRRRKCVRDTRMHFA